VLVRRPTTQVRYVCWGGSGKSVQGEACMATIDDVARAAGVSITTVSRVISDHPRVRPQTRGRVEDAMRRLGFIPNPSARRLTFRASRIVALVVPDIVIAFFAEVAQGAQDMCDRFNYSLMIFTTSGDAGKERRVLEGLCHQQ